MPHVDCVQHVATIRRRYDPRPLCNAGSGDYIRGSFGDETVKRSGGIAAIAGVAGVAASLMLAPAAAQTSRSAPSLRGAPAGSFTPAVADPRLAAALARRGSATPRFRFTPAMTSAERRRPVQVAVRARPATTTTVASRVQTASETPVTAVTPASYNLGASVGWRRFAISGDVAESRDGVVTGRRASAQVGMSYRANQRITARVQASAEQAEGGQRIVAEDEAYAVDVGGSYSIARNVDVTGGVRYRIARDRLEPLATDQRRDSQAVYIGTAFRF
jgi:hypothetical protein